EGERRQHARPARQPRRDPDLLREPGQRHAEEEQRQGPEEAVTKDVEKAGMQYFMPASLLVLLFGIAMVVYSPVYNFSDTWIALGLIGYAATFVTGAFFIGPTAGKLSKALETEGPEGATSQALRKRIFAISRIDQVVLTLVIADMVFKPGR
ncbi:MAG: hypothetical protein ACXWYE_04060, partial [Actinomycetota bacterium]